MQLPKSILVPTDFSEASYAALDYAVALAALTGASVTVMHAYETLGLPEGPMIARGDLVAQLPVAPQAALDKCVAKHAASGVTMDKVLRHGVPSEEVNSVAADVNADLIVVGTHGRRGLTRALLGSVAENVIRTATRPVLTIHAPN
jgi:nucleotide-binding universal stress UspA family protein